MNLRIVRLLLDDDDSVKAESYFNRAALQVNATTDLPTLLNFKLCQAQIQDCTRKFLEAAARYHELSWAGELEDEERKFML